MSSTQESSPPQRGGVRSAMYHRWEQYTHLSMAFSSAGRVFLKELWAALREGNLRVLFKNHDVQERSFAKWFKENGHGFANYEATTSVPSLVGSAHGTILDLGPGIGNQMPYFSKTNAQHIFGIEPNTSFANVFTERIKATGWEDKYTPIFCGIEDTAELQKHGIVPGSVDCVVSMQVFCSVSNPPEVAREVYSLLKPGGELIFWEHQRSASRITWAVQWFWSQFWSVCLAGCRLDKALRDSLLGAGDWELVQIEEDKDRVLIMPRVWGRLVKRSG